MSTYDREPLDPWRDSNNFPELQGPAVEAALANETLIDERTSLLGNRAYLDDDDDDDTYGDESGDHQERRRGIEIHASGKFWRDMRIVGPQEAKILVKYSGPLIITYMLQIGLRIVDIWFIGHLGATELAAASLGGMFCMITGFALGWGMTTAMDTLSSQAHTGATNPQMAGLILQRAVLIQACLCVPISIIWFNAESILISLGQTLELAEMAQLYIWIIWPALLPTLATACLRKYLQSQGLMRATTHILFIAFPFNILSNIFYLRFLNLGFIGVPLAISTTYYFIIIVMILYIRFATDYRRSWGGWSRDALKGWGVFLKLGVPGMLSVSTDWAFEVCAIAAGVLGKTSLAAQSIAVSSNTFLIMIPFAIAISTAVRTGHNLGALRPNAARVTAWWSVVIAVFVCVTNSSLLIALRYRYARWFTDDTDVIGVVIELVPVVAATQFCMGIGAILSGVLNGSGRQRTVALLNISSYFLLGLPLGLFLCFRCDMGLVGIWWGVFAAGVIKISGEMLVVGYTNWVGEAERAVKRVREGRRVGGRQY